MVVSLPRFKNLELTDFSRPELRRAMEAALFQVRKQLGREYDLLIGGRWIKRESKFESINPSQIDEVIGRFQEADPLLAETIVEAAEAGFKQWSRQTAEERVEAVLEVANQIRKRRLELAAWMVLEVGKSWVEADADVAEAVDFCEYYAREALRLDSPPPLVSIESEDNHLHYLPLGVGLIISPWNFPLAILVGMTMAAVVTGNSVIVKPSSDSAAIAAQFVNICQQVGFADGVINFVTGSGPNIAEPLVKHPRIRFISFTGSKAVGLRINELAAKTQPGQIWIKRVVAEMGGKDSIVVDADCDLDEAAAGVAAAAFGFQGQKCSACSRVIVSDSVYSEFVKKLIEQSRNTVREGSVESGDSFGPVINRRAQQKILDYIETGKQEGRLLMGGETGDPRGFNIRPTIFGEVDPQARIAQEEIFGPFLAVIRAANFEEALAIANNTVYGLTGAVYTRDEEKISRAGAEFHVGNLYLNRKCTGALVGVHPFGGFNLSGTDSKAGGPDYLLLFTQAKSISRKV